MVTGAPTIPDSISQDEWVEAQLIRTFMGNAMPALAAMALVIPIVAIMMRGDVNDVGLAVWTAAAVITALMRFVVVRRYRRDFAAVTGRPLAEFWSRHGWCWPLSALVWSASTALYFEQIPAQSQFVCMMALVGMGAFAVGGLSASQRVFVTFVNALTFPALCVMGFHIAVLEHFEAPGHDYALVVLTLIYWAVVQGFGRRFHAVQRSSFELQYKNNQLIASLTRQTQAALDAVAVKNRFLASAAHDIRQPVHAMRLYADWLVSEPELVRDIAPKIVESTKAVNALFDSLFDLARLDSGKIRINVEQVDVARLLHALEVQYRPLAEAKGLQWRMHVVPGSTVSDPMLLQRILGNLLSNAIKYTQQGGILLASRRTARGMRLDIWDTGVGIAPDHQTAIFREFYKVPAHAGTDDGFGLGLSIASRLAIILGHPLRMTSRAGRGTVFRLSLEGTDAALARARADAMVQLVKSP